MNDHIEPDPIRRPIVAITNGEVMADSRDIAAFFGKEHRRVLQTIREARCSEDFRRHNFVPFKIKDLTGESTSHVLMTKNGFAFVVLAFTGEKAARFREDYILAFDAMEAELRRQVQVPAFAIPQSLPEALRLAADLAEENGRHRVVIEQQGAAIAALEPKATAYARIAESDGSMCVTDAAKSLGIQPKILFAFLRANGWIYTRAGCSEPVAYQSRIVAGYLEHKVTIVPRPDGTEKTVTRVRVTPKGLARLAEEFALA